MYINIVNIRGLLILLYITLYCIIYILLLGEKMMYNRPGEMIEYIDHRLMYMSTLACKFFICSTVLKYIYIYIIYVLHILDIHVQPIYIYHIHAK